MLPDNLSEKTVPAALAAWDAEAVKGGAVEYGEITLWIAPEKIFEVCRYLKDEWKFVRLSGLSAIDRYPQEPRFEVFYLLHSLERNERLRLKLAVAGGEVRSVTGVWASANWYERETFDLFGVQFTGHPDLKRIMMPENWEGHPLRKDFPIHGHKYSYQNE